MTPSARPVKKVADARVLVEALEDVADFAFLKVAHRQTKDVAVEVHHHLHVYPPRGVGQQVVTKGHGRRLKNGDEQHPDEQDVEHRSALVDQHLVNDDLGKDRGGQSKQLQNQRGEKDFEEQSAVGLEQRQKPSEGGLRLVTLSSLGVGVSRSK